MEDYNLGYCGCKDSDKCHQKVVLIKNLIENNQKKIKTSIFMYIIRLFVNCYTFENVLARCKKNITKILFDTLGNDFWNIYDLSRGNHISILRF